MDLSQLLDFSGHVELVKWYMREYDREPPLGYRKVTVQQIITTDREIFKRLAELSRSGLESLGDGLHPLTARLQTVSSELRIH